MKNRDYLMLCVLFLFSSLTVITLIVSHFLYDSKRKTAQNELNVPNVLGAQNVKPSNYRINEPVVLHKYTFPDPKPDVLPPTNLSQFGWIPEWDIQNGLNSFQNVNTISSISPVLYTISSSGKLKLIVNESTVKNIVSTVKNKNGKILPLIQSFDKNSLSNFLVDPKQSSQAIIFLVKENGFDGIDINFEDIKDTDSNMLYSFINELSFLLKRENKEFSYTVLPKWTDDAQQYSYAKVLTSITDYKRIGEKVDQLRIMAFDYSPKYSGRPGPIAPKEWVEKILTYSVSKVPANKIVLGTPLYGYSWSPQGIKSYTNKELQLLNILQKGIVDVSGENTYKINSTEYWFQTPDSIRVKKELAAKYNIKGLIYWRIGNDNSIFN